MREKILAALAAGIDVQAAGADCLLADQSGGGEPKVRPEEAAAAAVTATAPPDYAEARWVPAAYWNYWNGRSQKVTKLVVHTVQGSYGSAINWFQNEVADVSANYVASSGGEITQMVRDHDTPWHVGSANPYCWGVEHEGWVDDGTPPSEAMLLASARLFAYACRRFDLDPDTAIVGHRDVPGQTHTDPGNEWPMARFKTLVKSFLGRNTGEPSDDPVLKWVNWAYTTEWGRIRATAAAEALHAAGFAKTLPTAKLDKAVDDALDGTRGNHPVVVLGEKSWSALRPALREKLERSFEQQKPYRYDVWAGRNNSEVRWRLSEICKRAGLDAQAVLADYQHSLAKLGTSGPGNPVDGFTPGPDLSSPYARGPYDLVGAERFSKEKIKAWARTHGAHPRCYTMIDAIYQVVGEAWRANGNPVYAADEASIQFCHETGFGYYRGDSKPWNPAGIKKRGRTLDRPEDFEVPGSAYEGARMLVNHMSVYIGGKPYGEVHGRYHDILGIRWNTAKTVDDLTGTWAMDPAYARTLRKYIGELEGGIGIADKINSFSRSIEGAHYATWALGTDENGPPIYFDGNPGASVVNRHGTICSGYIVLLMHLVGADLSVLKKPGVLPGGTLSMWNAWGGIEAYVPGKSYPAWTVFGTPYEGDIDRSGQVEVDEQGHVCISREAGSDPLLWQSLPVGGVQKGLRLSQTFRPRYVVRPDKWRG